MRRVAGVLVVLAAGAAHADSPSHARKHARTASSSRFSSPSDADRSPAVRYGQLSQGDCETELAVRHIAFVRESARGVRAPVRLLGPLHGVTFHADVSESSRETTPYEIADCRLVLALDDFSQILAAHDVVEVRHYSMYRPPPKSWPDDKEAIQHAGALALDAASFVKTDGTKLVVLKDFHGHIGAAPTCGDKAKADKVTPESTEIRAILCEAVDRHLFNVVLTPNYNKPHRNHFHLEVMAGVKWFLVH
ncbi:MAG TPA: extensin family protein [Kofleriaceae bacterium]|nr:extensin family protein [Kofleriaceae bacterium]